MLTDTQVQEKVNSIVSYITQAVDTLRNAGPVDIVVTTLGDRGALPAFGAGCNAVPPPYTVAQGRQRVTNAILTVNQGLINMASARGVAIADNYNFGNSLLAQVDQNGYYHIGGELISMRSAADEPHHMLLGDNEHPGTVMSGVLSNFIAINTLNTAFGTTLIPFSDSEILVNGGIEPQVMPSPTPSPSPNYTVNNLKTAILSYLGSDSTYHFIDGILNNMDLVYIIKWISW